MSTPRCFRLAIEGCRPSRSSALQGWPTAQFRNYSSQNRISGGVDITSGFPTPATESQVQSTSNTVAARERSPDLRRSKRKNLTDQPSESRQSLHKIESGESKSSLSPARPRSEKENQQPTSSDTPDSVSGRKPYPPNVLAAYRKPMKYPAEHRIPVGSLQLRSYSVRNLEFFADFAMRAAFYLQLPASGPVPLPKLTERWTMPRSNFVHKKSQENFERITLRRLITVMDGEKSVVETWLAFLRKWQFYGVGMKANVWEFEGLDVTSKMDREVAQAEKELDEKLANFGFNKTVANDKDLQEMMRRQGPNHVAVPMTYLRPESTTADQRI